MVYFLGIDAGGSHCRSRLTDERGTILGTGESGPANTRIGIERLHVVLNDVAGQAISAPAKLDDPAQFKCGGNPASPGERQ